MSKIKTCLFNTLGDMGIEKEFITDMNMTTDELGLSSLELVNLAIAFYDEFGIKLRLVKNNVLSLNDLCLQVADKIKCA